MKEKLTPFGALIKATAALTLIFGSAESSDFWVDALKFWWESVKDEFSSIRTLVVYLDNGPHNSGSRTRFLQRMVEFADWSGLTIRLVYYPPYHSKYNLIERCWSALEQKWNGTLLTSLQEVLYWARRMSWRRKRPQVEYLPGEYPSGVRVSGVERKEYEARLTRSKTLPRYDITITPKAPHGG